MRQVQSLTGTWQFHPDPTGECAAAEVEYSREIPVPLPWQAAFPDLQTYSGWAWYRREFDLAADWLNSWQSGDVLLTFGAVDYWCEVFVNGTRLGDHEGGYTPFSFAVGALLREGTNEVVVRVYDPAQQSVGRDRYPNATPHQTPFDALDVPHGKQEWYVNVGGIWQDVTLTAVPRTYLRALKVTPALDGTVVVEAEIAGDSVDAWSCDVEVAYMGATVAHATAQASGTHAQATLKVADPHLWSPDHPALYTLMVQFGDDQSTTRFGFRTIETRDGKILLNGEPIYLLAALDQDFYADTIYTPPSETFLRDQFAQAKALGLNCLRLHIKVPDPLYFDLADEIGLLVWTEIPSWRTFFNKGNYLPDQLRIDDALKARVETTLTDMIARDFNHPSIIIWTLVNEDWGTALPLSGADRAWLCDLYARCKQIDPTRLVVDNSACPTGWGPNIHLQSDLDDFHVYTNVPDSAATWEHAADQLNLRALWTYSQFGDSHRRGDEPIILSEFGNWGLPSVEPYLNDDGSEPNWFNLGPWWSGWDGEPGWMRGVLGRFTCYGLDAIFGDFASLARATQWHQYQALKFEIEALRRQPNIMGYVITELSDIYWEGNGFLDFARRPKIFSDVFANVNSPDLIAARLPRYAYWDDESVPLILQLSHFSGKDWSGARATMTLDAESLDLSLPAVAQAELATLSAQTFALSPVDQAQVKRVELQIVAADETSLDVNCAKFLVLPASARTATYTGAVAVVDAPNPFASEPNPFAQAVRAVGYHVVDQLSDAKLAVSNLPDADLLAWVRAGGDLLFLCGGASPFFWAHPRGGAYNGDWMTCWTWLRPEIHPRLAHEHLNPLKLPFVNVMPRFVILGLPVEAPEYHTDFLAGQFTGWINHPAVETVQFRYGAGRVIMTTFSLAQALGRDPVATAMFHDLVDHLTGDNCNPSLQANW